MSSRAAESTQRLPNQPGLGNEPEKGNKQKSIAGLAFISTLVNPFQRDG